MVRERLPNSGDPSLSNLVRFLNEHKAPWRIKAQSEFEGLFLDERGSQLTRLGLFLRVENLPRDAGDDNDDDRNK